MKSRKNDPIDIVIPWVNGNDPEWRREKEEFVRRINPNVGAISNVRYESWDNLQYIFRAIEQFMPWVHKVYFVTWGHLPDFLDIQNPKIEIVRHQDYIPQKYLPTFNSNVIEMNYHRIKNLSENFILFNDDLFPLSYVDEKYFFRNNLPCEEAVEGCILPYFNNPEGILHSQYMMNNLAIINKHFKKRDVQKKDFFKWFYPGYGKLLKRNLVMHYWNNFTGFHNSHAPVPLKKSVLAHLWDIEENMLDIASKNHFRAATDVTQYVVRYWILCSGGFYPQKASVKYCVVRPNTCREIAEKIRKSEYKEKFICLRDDCSSEEFEQIKKEINAAFEMILPQKSSFEI